MNVLSMATAVLVVVAVIILSIIGAVVMIWNHFRRQARRLGYPSMGAYLGAAPCSDEEKRDAVDLALKGMVMCLLGLVFPPLLLIGSFPPRI